MKENTIYFRDHRGVIRSMSVKEYETKPGTRTILHERMDFITKGEAPYLRTLQGDGGTGKEQVPENKDQGQSVRETGGETTSKANNPQPVQRVEKTTS